MAKSATFGVVHVITAFSVTYAFTGSLSLAGIVTLVEPVVNTVVHYFFDKVWEERLSSRRAPEVDHFSTNARSMT